jgi:hypothetical protein
MNPSYNGFVSKVSPQLFYEKMGFVLNKNRGSDIL